MVEKEFKSRDKVLLYNSRLCLFLGKPRSRWLGPFVVDKAYPSGMVEIITPEGVQKVNGHRLKHYRECREGEEKHVLLLRDA